MTSDPLTSGKLGVANEEVDSLRAQLAIMEQRTKNLNILADDVNGVSAEEVWYSLLFSPYKISVAEIWFLVFH